MKDRVYAALHNRYVLLGLYLVLAIWAVLMQYFSGSGHNNFDIYTGVARHFFDQMSLFGPSPTEYSDMNHYGPLFAFVIYPFTMWPHLMGVMLWVVFTGVVLWLALDQLPIGARAKTIVLWLGLLEFYNAAAYQQFNSITVAMIVLSFVSILQKREWAAALFIVVGTMIKLYGVVGLAFFFFIEPRRRWRFLGYLVLHVVLLFGLQIAFTSWDYVSGQYQEWWVDLFAKNETNQFSPYQNRGLLGLVRKVSGLASYSDLWLIGSGLVIYGLSFLRVNLFSNKSFQMLLLSSTLLFVVLFSTGTETCSYITATIGVGLWWCARQGRGGDQFGSATRALDWSLMGLCIVGSLANALFPPSIYLGVIFPYALKALPFSLVWFRVSYELLTIKK